MEKQAPSTKRENICRSVRIRSRGATQPAIKIRQKNSYSCTDVEGTCVAHHFFARNKQDSSHSSKYKREEESLKSRGGRTFPVEYITSQEDATKGRREQRKTLRYLY